MTTQEGMSLQAPTEAAYTLQQNRLLATAVGLGAAALSGLFVSLTMPYGPTTTAQVFIVMLVGLAAGFIGGAALQTRWALLLIPLAHVVFIELARMNVVGPTVDGLRLDNPYGILALIVGRGFHALVGLLPMLLGVGLGLRFAHGRTGQGGTMGMVSLGILGVIVAGLAVATAVPATTPPILDADGEPVPGSIAELETVTLGGQEQTIMIRAHSPDNPVLLYLSGGPGQSDLPYARVLFEDLTEDFVVVGWDQRGTGKSYNALHPAETLTPAQAVADTIALTNYLRQRFDEEKIYLMGESWGTTLGVLAVQERPDLYHAWIGSGQMVSQRETDRRLYYDVLALAEETGNTGLAEQMHAYGEPPYEDIPYPNAIVMGQYEALYKPYTPPQAYIERGTAANLGPYAIFGSEYNFVEKFNVLRGLIDMFTIMYPQIQGVDFRQDVPSLDVPVYILDGEAEATARRDLMLEWYEQLEAPTKEMVSFENAGHSVAFEQFEALHRILNETIVPNTYTD